MSSSHQFVILAIRVGEIGSIHYQLNLSCTTDSFLRADKQTFHQAGINDVSKEYGENTRKKSNASNFHLIDLI